MKTEVFLSLILIGAFIFVTAIAIACFIDFLKMYEDDYRKMKKSVKDWHSKTKLSMWNHNRKNRVKILSEKEYFNLMKEGKIKYVVIEEEG